LLWANSFAKACSIEANPFETFILLTVAFSPVFNLLDNGMKDNTKERKVLEE